ncbi:MAG TPA: pitrilysin family protein [Gemmatimonadaceae bacterium]
MSVDNTGVRPIPGPPRPYHFPDFQSVRLSNGVEVIAAPVNRLPVATIRLVIDAGARTESSDEAGVAALTASGLAEGTTRADAATMADEFEQLGGSLSTTATWDATQAATTVLADRFESAFRLLAEVVRTPALPAREINRLREERLAELLELRSEPRGLADERFAGILYQPTSRFSLPEAGSEDTVRELKASRCRTWHERHFVPAAVTVIVCGDVELGRAATVAEEVLGDWMGVAPPPQAVDDSPRNVESAIHLIHRAGAPQTELRLGHVALPRHHPDYYDVVVMNAILGGVFNSRINLNLRERHGYTYGAFSSFEWRRDAGPFSVSTAVATNVTGAAVREAAAELERMKSGPPTDGELALCTSYLEGVFPIRFETTDAIAGALAALRVFRLSEDYFDTYRERIRGVSAEGVMRAARAHLHTRQLQVLAVGDREQIAQGLGELGLGTVSEVPA